MGHALLMSIWYLRDIMAFTNSSTVPLQRHPWFVCVSPTLHKSWLLLSVLQKWTSQTSPHPRGPSRELCLLDTVWWVVGRWVTFRPSMDEKGDSNLIQLRRYYCCHVCGRARQRPVDLSSGEGVGGDESRGWCRRRLGMVRSSFY
jgi:hypothetical protein